MKIHEYQAKKIFREAGVAVPRGIVADSPQAVGEAFAALGGQMAVVKAQIHAGGRGKGSIAEIPSQRGVQIVRSREEAETAAGNLLGHRLVTIQTGVVGKTVHRVLVEEGVFDQKGILSGGGRRSRHRRAGADRLAGRRRGDRASGIQDARPHPRGAVQSLHRIAAASDPQTRLAAWLAAGRLALGRATHASVWPRIPGSRLQHVGNQSVGADRRRSTLGAGRQNDLR